MLAPPGQVRLFMELVNAEVPPPPESNFWILQHYSYGVLGLAWRYFTLLIPRLASSAIGALSLVAYGAAGGLCFQALQQGTEDAITKDA